MPLDDPEDLEPDDFEEPDLDEPEDLDELPFELPPDFEPPDLLAPPPDLLPLDFDAPDLLLDFEALDLAPLPDELLLALPDELFPLLAEDEDFDAPFAAEDLAAEPDLEAPDDFDELPFADEADLRAAVDFAPELLLLEEAAFPELDLAELDLLELDLAPEPPDPELFVVLDDFELDFFDAGIFFLLFLFF